MNNAIQQVLEIYAAGFQTKSPVNFELGNLLLEGNPELRAAVISYVEENYGWMDRYKTTSEQLAFGTPFNHIFTTYAAPSRFNKLPIKAVPSWVKILNVAKFGLTELPELPRDLEWLACNDNNLTSLPALPAGLQRLECYNNKLTALPAVLPARLKQLECYNNKITVLPAIPKTVNMLCCSSNPLTNPPKKGF
jgi:Leucine-rich repeat (LRR) protein